MLGSGGFAGAYSRRRVRRFFDGIKNRERSDLASVALGVVLFHSEITLGELHHVAAMVGAPENLDGGLGGVDAAARSFNHRGRKERQSRLSGVGANRRCGEQERKGKDLA